MKEIFQKIFTYMLQTFKGVDNEASSKRATLFWIAVPLWGLIHITSFCFHTKLNIPDGILDSLVWCDSGLIASLCGLTVVERIKTKNENNP
jgi:hypothetical protein